MAFGQQYTYTNDVAPIIHKYCLTCHYVGGPGPMPLSSFEQVRPWAKAIKQRVLDRTMPPWPADARFGDFTNASVLSTQEVNTIAAWVNSDARPGEPVPSPHPSPTAEAWKIGTPDVVLDTGVDFDVRGSGDLPEQVFRIEWNASEDQWVTAAEVLPSAPNVVHHVVVRTAKFDERPSARSESILTTWVPGEEPFVASDSTARILPGKSFVIFEIHYVSNGHTTFDRTRLGLKISRQRPKFVERIQADDYGEALAIPPGKSDYEVRGELRIPRETWITGWLPHMHGRGKDVRIKIVYPDGREEIVLSIPHYDWHWQIFYRLRSPDILPAGTRVEFVAHYDNSANNRNNPDPLETVVSGPHAWNEMLTIAFSYLTPSFSESDYQ